MFTNFDVTPSFLFTVLLACNKLQPSKTQVNCNDYPCFNGGTCVPGPPDMCSCPAGYVQPFCTISCQNMFFLCVNGVCADNVCNCDTNFAGPTCASAIAAYLSPLEVTVTEGHVGQKEVTVQVCRQPSSEEVTLAVITAADTAVEGSDFVSITNTQPQDVIISARQTCTSVIVFIISDLTTEMISKSFRLIMYVPQSSSSSSSMIDIVSGHSQTTITITDDDPDTEPPTIHNCPDDISVTALVGAAAATVSWTPPTATDPSGAVTVTLTSSQNPGESFSIGSTQVTYLANDGANNFASCVFTVTVVDRDECTSTLCDSSSSTCINTMGSYMCVCKFGYTGSPFTPGQPFTCADMEPPTIHNCPDDITVTAPAGAASTTVSWTPPTATDPSGAVTFTSSGNPGDSFFIGSKQVTYTAIDGANNFATCSFTVTVLGSRHR